MNMITWEYALELNPNLTRHTLFKLSLLNYKICDSKQELVWEELI